LWLLSVLPLLRLRLLPMALVAAVATVAVSFAAAMITAGAMPCGCSWSAVAHLGGKDFSLWMAAYPTGYQPNRK
jgi:hypothetical protein